MTCFCNNMKIFLRVLLAVWILISCGNSKCKKPVGIDNPPSNKQFETVTVLESSSSNEEQTVPANSSSFLPSHSDSSNGNDNMRGFDPISEDDMEDGGMSRYMENNDDEGWD